MATKQQSRVIINGDDFGMSPGVNEAVRQLHRKRRLTSVSVMTNMPCSKEALDYARSASNLKLGVHLNLTTGRPVLPIDQVPSLVTSDGEFYDLSLFLSRFVAGLVNYSQVRAELEAQMAICSDSGIHLSHVDSHMHFHAVPALGELASTLAGRFGVTRVRNPDLSAFIVPPFGRAKLVEKTLLKTGTSVIQSTQRIMARRGILLNGPDYRAEQLIYLRWCLGNTSNPLDKFRACIDGLEGNSLEIVAHPAVEDEVLPSLSNYVAGRQQELDFLGSEQFSELLERI